jgi:hypothetical protein
VSRDLRYGRDLRQCVGDETGSRRRPGRLTWLACPRAGSALARSGERPRAVTQMKVPRPVQMMLDGAGRHVLACGRRGMVVGATKSLISGSWRSARESLPQSRVAQRESLPTCRESRSLSLHRVHAVFTAAVACLMPISSVGWAHDDGSKRSQDRYPMCKNEKFRPSLGSTPRPRLLMLRLTDAVGTRQLTQSTTQLRHLDADGPLWSPKIGQLAAKTVPKPSGTAG